MAKRIRVKEGKGRPVINKEKTKVVPFRCPISKVSYFQQYCKIWLEKAKEENKK